MRRSFAVLAGSWVLLSGCGATPEVSTGDLERQISTRLAEDRGVAPRDTTCDDRLPAEEGEQVRCSLVDPASGEEYGVTVTASQVEGDEVGLRIEVDDRPMG